MKSNRPALAFVVQRYGPEVNGGAELHCRWVAEHLVPYYEVHVLTTCAVDYYTWEDAYRPGVQELNGVQVHRFRVDHARRWQQFCRLDAKVLGGPHTYLDELEWMRQQGPVSGPLLDEIRGRRTTFASFIFFTYLYAHTYYGLPLAAEKAILVPTAHDDPALRLDLFRGLFHLPRHIIYNTETERDLVHAVAGNARVPSSVLGTGINLPDGVQAGRFRRKYGIAGDFLLYVGRVDESKNCPELIAFFRQFRASGSRDLKLVLIGKPGLAVPKSENVVSLGYLPEEDKFDAIQAAAVVVVPSRFESLSMAMLEAWLLERPVLANGRCAVLREQSVRGQGALWYDSYDEFALALELLLARPGLAACLGRNGCAYAKEHYAWAHIERSYLDLLAGLERQG